MDDYILRVTAPGIRAFIATTTNLTEEARCRHDCYPTATAALGRTMTAAALLAANLKNEEALTIRIEGDGPLGNIVADAAPNGAVRGYVKNPHANLPLNDNKLNVGQAVGSGNIFITRFTGLKQPFTGSASLISGEIAEDVANYMFVSEQTPSTIALGVLVQPDLTVSAAGGFFIQALPEAEDDKLSIVEDNLKKLKPISQLINSGMDAKQIAVQLFAGLPVVIHETTTLAFSCPCSREKVENTLISLGKDEINAMIEEDGQAEVICHFCREKYRFERKALKEILETIKT